MRLIACAVGAMLLTTSSVIARNLILVYASVKPPINVFIMDQDSVRKIASGKTRVWTYSYNKSVTGLKATGATFYEFDCDEERFHGLTSRLHNPDGTFIVSDDSIKAWEYAAPDTLISFTMAYVCGTKSIEKEIVIGDKDPFEFMRGFSKYADNPTP